MTAKQPPYVLADASIEHDAEGFRRLVATLTGDAEGVFRTTDMAVSQKSGGANMSVDVAGGRAVIKGDGAVYAGSYFVENRGVRNVTIAAADATNPRWDLIVARVRDSAYSGSDDDWDIIAVTGTPAAVPVDPTPPDNSITLARVSVAALASSISNASIFDVRTSYVLRPQVFTSTVSNGTATSYTSFIAQNSIGVAPYDLTMLLQATGDQGTNAALNTPKLRFLDQSGTIIPSGLVHDADAILLRNYDVTAGTTWAYTVAKDYTAGQTMGFRLQYLVDTSNIYIGARVVVSFIPK